jgi:hypothetical protein
MSEHAQHENEYHGCDAGCERVHVPTARQLASAGGQMRWQATSDARLHPYNQPTNPVSAINAREGKYHHQIKACQRYLRALTRRGAHSRLPCSGSARIFLSRLTSCA